MEYGMVSALRCERQTRSERFCERFREGSGCDDDVVRIQRTLVGQDSFDADAARLESRHLPPQEAAALPPKKLSQGFDERFRIHCVRKIRNEPSAQDVLCQRWLELAGFVSVEKLLLDAVSRTEIESETGALIGAFALERVQKACTPDQFVRSGLGDERVERIMDLVKQALPGACNFLDSFNLGGAGRRNEPRQQ